GVATIDTDAVILAINALALVESVGPKNSDRSGQQPYHVAVEAGGNYPDNLNRRAVEQDRATDNIGRSAEMALPIPVANRDDIVFPRDVLPRKKSPTLLGLNPEHRKEIGHDAQGV